MKRCNERNSDLLRWEEHYLTRTRRMMRRTLEGYWCDKHRTTHPTKVIKTEMVHE